MSRIHEIEESEEFQTWALRYQGEKSDYQRPQKLSKEEKKIQKIKAKKELDNEILKLAEKVEISFPSITEEVFYPDLVQRYNDYLNYLYVMERRTDGEDLDLENDGIRKINGRLIQFLCEEIATYSEPFSSIQRKIGRKKALVAVQEKALVAIVEAYPWLEFSANRQLRAIQKRQKETIK